MRVYIIHGNPATKKNGMRILRTKAGRPFIKPSAAYEKYEKEALKQLNELTIEGTITEPVNIKVHYYMDSRRRVDISNLLEATMDILQRTDVPIILDDCATIVAGHDGTRVYYDKENPRAEIYIEEMDEDV